MNIKEIYKEHYFFEIKRKHQITSQLGIPIGVLTVLGGALTFFVKGVQYTFDTKCFILAGTVLISIFFLGRTMYFLIRSYHGYTYRYVPTPQKIEDYRKELSAYYEKEATTKGDANKEIEDFLIGRYALCSHENTINNDSKSAYLHKANSSLIFTLIFVIICSVPYLFIKFTQPEQIQKIEIVNLPVKAVEKEKIMAEENQDQGQNRQPQQGEPKEPKEPPVKPKPPEDRLVYEDKQPEKIRK